MKKAYHRNGNSLNFMCRKESRINQGGIDMVEIHE